MIVNSVGLYNIIRKYVPLNILQKFNIIPSKHGDIADTTEISSLIDWNKSKVLIVPIGDGLLYINPKILPPKSQEYDDFINKVANELNELKTPDEDDVFDRVYKKEELYSGEYLGSAPDIILLPNEGIHMPIVFGHDNEIWIDQQNTSFFSANHKLHGIFLAHGPDIKQNATIEGARIIDLAPTILHMFGTPIPKDMDGRVLTEIFREDSEMAQREIVYEEDKTKTENDRDALKNRIGKLKQKRKI